MTEEENKPSEIETKIMGEVVVGLARIMGLGMGASTASVIAPQLAGAVFTEDPRGKNGESHFKNLNASQKTSFYFVEGVGLLGLIVACTYGVKLKRQIQSLSKYIIENLDKEKDKPLYVNFY